MPAFSSLVIPVTDLEAAKAVYGTALGVEPHTDTPYYVGYNVDGFEVALAPKQDADATTVAYVDHPDMAEAVSALTGAGATVIQEPTQVAPEAFIAVLADGDGNRFGIRAPR